MTLTLIVSPLGLITYVLTQFGFGVVAGPRSVILSVNWPLLPPADQVASLATTVNAPGSR